MTNDRRDDLDATAARPDRRQAAEIGLDAHQLSWMTLPQGAPAPLVDGGGIK